jgi:hypothetical protein
MGPGISGLRGCVVIIEEEGHPNSLHGPKAIMQYNCFGTTPRPDRACEKCPSEKQCTEAVGCVVIEIEQERLTIHDVIPPCKIKYRQELLVLDGQGIDSRLKGTIYIESEENSGLGPEKC